MTKKENSKEEQEMSFLDHLEELRWHIIRSFVSILIFAIVIFLMKSFVFDYIIFAPLNDDFWTYQFFCSLSEKTCFYPPELEIIPREFGERFITHIKVSFWLGLTVSFPYIFWEIWRFIKPGLYKNEKKAARGMVFICSFLFVLGVMFGFYIIAPFAINFIGGYTLSSEEVYSSFSLSSYVNTLTFLTIPTGIIFELPILVYFLSKIGILYPDFMKKYRRHAIIVILIFAAIITPPDVLTQFLIGIPIYILYEISIIISKRVHANKEKEDLT